MATNRLLTAKLTMKCGWMVLLIILLIQQRALSQNGNDHLKCEELATSLSRCDKSDSFKSKLIENYVKRDLEQRALINIKNTQADNRDSVIVRRNEAIIIKDQEIKTWTSKYIKTQESVKYYVVVGAVLGVLSRFITFK